MEKKKVMFPNLRAEMVKRGDNQTTIAKLLGISDATCSKKMRGTCKWYLEEVDTLCEYFGKDYYYLFK